jgi:hypothetical protein
MATNLVSLIMQYLTPEMIGRIAAATGLDRSRASTAVSASVPALLAALSNAATQPGGAQKLADAAKQHVGTLDNLASIIGGAIRPRSPTRDRKFLPRCLAVKTRPRWRGPSRRSPEWARA